MVLIFRVYKIQFCFLSDITNIFLQTGFGVSFNDTYSNQNKSKIIPSIYNVDFICGAIVSKTEDLETLDFSDDDDGDLATNSRFDTTRDVIGQTNVSQKSSSQSALGELDALTNVAALPLQQLQYCGISAAAYRFAAETLLGVFYVGPGLIKSHAVND